MDRSQHVSDCLAASITRLDVVLRPWGFVFQADEIQLTHIGPCANGHYCRGTTRIGLSCREMIDNIYYEHSIVTEYRWGTRETERFTIEHDTLMEALGHSNDSLLICNNRYPDLIIARDGGDRVEALIHDLVSIASPVLREPCEQFDAIMRTNRRRTFHVD